MWMCMGMVMFTMNVDGTGGMVVDMYVCVDVDVYVNAGRYVDGYVNVYVNVVVCVHVDANVDMKMYMYGDVYDDV